MPKISIKVGRFLFYLWAGSWSWWEHLPCAHCKNLYVGPFGFEWETPEVENELEDEFRWCPEDEEAKGYELLAQDPETRSHRGSDDRPH